MTYDVGSTIGPVYAVIQKARRPREIWMASYMFSRIAQEMTAYLAEYHRADFVSPFDQEEIGRKIRGAGAYSDRLFFSVEAENEIQARDYVQMAMEYAVDILTEDMHGAIGDEAFNSDACRRFLMRYIYHRTTVRKRETGQRSMPMHEMTQELDRMETFVPYVDEEKRGESDYILRYLNSEQLRASRWVREHQVESHDLGRMAQAGRDEAWTWQRYIAVVRADGDKMGSLLCALSEAGYEDMIKEVSAFLIRRASENVNMVKAYGGLPIYFGGDDMLFIAPLYSSKSVDSGLFKDESLFSLLERLSKRFDDAFAELIAQSEKTLGNDSRLAKILQESIPSVSFGVAVCYHKYPLQMIMEMADAALFHEAKRAQWSQARKKKAVQIHLRKHSGQESKLLLSGWTENGGKSPYALFRELVDKKADSTVLHALHWKIMEQYDLIEYLLCNTQGKEREDRLKQWFEHNFNEWAAENTQRHSEQEKKQEEVDSFFAPIRTFICICADQLAGSMDREEKLKTSVDGIFRIDEFLHAAVKE